MTDMMVDLETTGTTSPDRNGIIQLAAIKFNYETGEVGGSFDRCPSLLATRHWDEDTRQFWMGKNKAVYDTIVARMESPIAVYGDFIRWTQSDEPEGGYRFWSKPTHFDWPMLASHLHQMGGIMPFHYRMARDLNSVMATLKGYHTGRVLHANMEAVIPFPAGGAQHNALHDCAYQLDMLLAAKAKNFSEIVA